MWHGVIASKRITCLRFSDCSRFLGVACWSGQSAALRRSLTVCALPPLGALCRLVRSTEPRPMHGHSGPTLATLPASFPPSLAPSLL